MTQITKSISEQYLNIAWWVENDTIEIMAEYGKGIVARAIDAGGVVWEGEKFTDLEQAMNALEEGIKKWDEENN